MAPPCFNADEAAFSYNAWSILKTGKDEYGEPFPLRLKSYGDYKLPLLTYLTIPFVGVFGLNETAARLPNALLAALFPLVIYFLTKELFGKSRPALLAALLVSVSLGMNLVGRHEHEAYLAAFLVSTSWWMYLRLLRIPSFQNLAFFLTPVLFSLFTYHSSRIFAAFFFMHSIYTFLIQKKKNGKIIVGSFLAILVLFTLTDVFIAPARVKNLIFFNNPGYVMRVQQLREEGGHRLFYNKLMPGIKDVGIETLKYFSPQFLTLNGDENFRFGHPGMGPLTVLEYLLAFVGIYYLFANKEKHRYLIALLLVASPLPASLSWAGMSLTRSLFIIVPILIVASYGVFSLMDRQKRFAWYILGVFCGLNLLLNYYSWDFFFNHYPKRAIVVRSWQCGYKELGSFIQTNYDKYDKIYISRQHGQPYIFMLFFLKYDPARYQKQAQLSAPDEYGFGQVEKFDKFVFEIPATVPPGEKSLVVGFPVDDFLSKATPLPNLDQVEKIKIGTEEIFWLYDNAKLNTLQEEVQAEVVEEMN